MDERVIPVRGERERLTIMDAGSGPPMVFLPDVWGLHWDPFLEAMSEAHRVLGVHLPGTGGSTGDEWIIDLFDLTYLLTDLLDELDLDDVVVVGNGLGGMLAAELAAMQPQRYRALVLISAYGLWNEAHPNVDVFFHRDQFEVLAAMTFHNPEHPFRTVLFPQAESRQEHQTQMVERAQTLQAAAKHLWPLPDRGLARRIHRIISPTLIVWGRKDGVVPVQYAEDFARLIPHATIQIQEHSGHLPQVEETEAVAAAVSAFLAAAGNGQA